MGGYLDGLLHLNNWLLIYVLSISPCHMNITIKKVIIISTGIVFMPVCIHRGQLWDPSAVPDELGGFLPGDAGLWVQTRPAALFCRFPHCAIHRSATGHLFGQRAGPRGALQSLPHLCSASLRVLPYRGWRASWKVQLLPHSNLCHILFHGIEIVRACLQ